MSDQKSDSSPIAESWDTYWQGARRSPTCSSEGSSHPAVLSFWEEFFETVGNQYDAPKIIDIASGSGAVVERARSALGGPLTDFTCVDISASAINMVQRRFPEVHGVVADVRSLPLDGARYDIATSQFGIEYAGLEAIHEVARLIAPGGQLALLLHNRAGGIYRQCAASLDAIQKMQDAKFIPYSIAMFEEGFAACRGADRAKYDAAAKRLVPAVRTMGSIMTQHGKHVADGTIIGLYNDVRRMHSRMLNYEPAEVLSWLKNLEGELPTYAGRMSSMCNAAIDAEAFEQLCDELRSEGYTILRGDPLKNPDRDQPLAWALVAAKT